MALNANALTDWNTYKVLFKQGMNEVPSTEQDRVEILINSASTLIEKDLKKPIKAQSYTVTIWNKLRNILLDHSPLNSITSITCDGVALIENVDYRLDKPASIITLLSIPNYECKYDIAYNAGYSVVPADLVQACLELVEYNKNRFKSGVNTSQFNTPGGSQVQVFQHEMPLSCKQILERYR